MSSPSPSPLLHSQVQPWSLCSRRGGNRAPNALGAQTGRLSPASGGKSKRAAGLKAEEKASKERCEKGEVEAHQSRGTRRAQRWEWIQGRNSQIPALHAQLSEPWATAVVLRNFWGGSLKLPGLWPAVAQQRCHGVRLLWAWALQPPHSLVLPISTPNAGSWAAQMPITTCSPPDLHQGEIWYCQLSLLSEDAPPKPLPKEFRGFKPPPSKI